MKKIICVLLCAICLCSCSGRTVKLINRGIGFRAHILFSGKEYNCDCIISSEGKGEYQIIDGNLEGFTATVCKENITYTFEGKEILLEKDFKNSLFYLLYMGLEYFSDKDMKATKSDGRYYLSGEIEGAPFTLQLTEMGLVTEMNIEDLNFSALFSEVTIIN